MLNWLNNYKHMSLLMKLWTSDMVHHENYLYNSLNLDYIYIYRERERGHKQLHIWVDLRTCQTCIHTLIASWKMSKCYLPWLHQNRSTIQNQICLYRWKLNASYITEFNQLYTWLEEILIWLVGKFCNFVLVSIKHV